MKTVLFILPALQEVISQQFRQIKYSLFPPLSLLTLAGSVPSDKYKLIVRDEHVEDVIIDEPVDLVVMTVYISSANRAYEISKYYRNKGAKVFMGGIHPTTLPNEALLHADSVCIGPGDFIFSKMLSDFENDSLEKVYYGDKVRELSGIPVARRDLMNRNKYLVPNTIVASRGCLYNCDFCYKKSFWGENYYKYRPLEDIKKELDTFKQNFVFFLDDNLMGNRVEARKIFKLLKEYNFTWQAAASIDTAYTPGFLEEAYDCGCRSLFVGFESILIDNMKNTNKIQNQKYDYEESIKRFHDAGLMINGSFVYGLDSDGPDVFERTIEFTIKNKIETATFHILTPFPGTKLFQKMEEEGRIIHYNWDKYDTRHAVYRPALMTPEELEAGYWQSYKEFYSYTSIFSRSFGLTNPLKRLAYNMGWKKMDGIWDFMIKNNLLKYIIPLFEVFLSKSTRKDKNVEMKKFSSPSLMEILPS